MEGLFSPAMEAQLMALFESKIDEALKMRTSSDPWENLATREEICEKFHIKSKKTIQNWEKEGLKRYVSPYIDSRIILYDKKEVAKFLGYNKF
ncbi:hypothetical protein [Lactococcus lactis]|uniref:DNA-binding protein n=1 Tax=Lactococcus lactis TaxID=1358 RepID=A0AAW5TWS1_9LACT|nr:hypothetical protein [Lactococcus lactis]MCW2281480.1 hypothetical protein [Lactococcus lactis]